MPPVATAKSSCLPLIALILVSVLGAVLRLWQVRESLWLDELHTAWCAVGTLDEVASRAASGNQSPLFFWLEWLLVKGLGKSEWTLRLPSLIAGCGLPLAIYVLLVRWTRLPWLGVLAAWLVVVDPRQIFFATEARPYALVELLAVWHVALFVELLQRPTARLRVLLVAGAALLFHLHYTAALLIAAEMAIYALATAAGQRDPNYGWWPFGLDLFFTAALWAPALANVEAIYARRNNWDFVAQQPATAILTLWPAARLKLWPAAIAALLPLVAIDSFVRKFSATSPRDRELPPLAILCWAIVPVALAWLSTASDAARLLFPRYLIASAPAATLLAVLSLRLVSWRSLQIVLGLGIAAFALRSSQVVEHLIADRRAIVSRPDDWRGAIAYFNAQPDRNRYPVLVRSWLIEADELGQPGNRELADYCLYPVTALYPIATDRANLIPLTRTQAGKLAADIREQIQSRGGAWLIVGGRREIAEPIVQEIVARLDGGRGELWRIDQQKSFGTIHVVRVLPGGGDASFWQPLDAAGGCRYDTRFPLPGRADARTGKFSVSG